MMMKLGASVAVRSRSHRKCVFPALMASAETFSSELAAMFEFSLEKTCELLREQLNQALKYGNIDIKVRI